MNLPVGYVSAISFSFFNFIFYQIVGSLVELYGTLEFLDNDVGDTAALELVSSSQLRLHQGARMEFKKNRGR